MKPMDISIWIKEQYFDMSYFNIFDSSYEGGLAIGRGHKVLREEYGDAHGT